MSNDNLLMIYVPRFAPIPGSGISGPDWTGVLDRIDVIEGGHNLGDHNDVDASGVADGQALIYHASDPVHPWKPGSAGGTIASIKQYDTTTGTTIEEVTDANEIRVTRGIKLTPGGGGTVPYIEPAYGGTGSADLVARWDHTHTAELYTLTEGAATGVLSSGTRVLHNAAGPALADGITYDVHGTFEVRGRNNVDNGTVNLMCRVGASGTYPLRTKSAVPTVGGVPEPLIVRFRAVLVGTGAAVTEYFAVQHNTFDPTDLRDWEIDISYSPRR